MSSEGPRALTCGSLGLRRTELEGECQDQSLSTGHGWGATGSVLGTHSWEGDATGAGVRAQGEREP